MENLINLLDDISENSFISGIISNKRDKNYSVDKIKLRKIILKGEILIQATEYTGTKVLHTNYTYSEITSYIVDNLKVNFKQCELITDSNHINILVSKKGKTTIKSKASKYVVKDNEFNHNKKKNYLIEEGEKVDFLIELGVMNKDGYIIKSKYDKFRQINRFLEFIEDISEKLPKKRQINIIDFGCGKSYLTFAIYYYLKIRKNLDINIVGLDLKKDVIKKCNELAEKLNYSNLCFINGDIADYSDCDEVDMVVTLHACDTATDFAIEKAIKWNAKVILSVPCCQHEINNQIQNELLSPILKYGILKERMSALITDGIRAELLNFCGYDTQILEFIDMEHTPKNLLIKAVKKNLTIKAKGVDELCDNNGKINQLISELNLNPKLKNLLDI